MRSGESPLREAFQEFPTPAGSDPYGITHGPDGRLWFAERSNEKIGAITTDGQVIEYPLPDPFTVILGSITLGPDGKLWFGQASRGILGKITTVGKIATSGSPYRIYKLPSGADPDGVTAGPDGNIWVAELAIAAIARVKLG
jgi:virginiamycin B lyase